MTRESHGATATADVEITDRELLLRLSGPNGAHLKVLEKELGIVLGQRGDVIRLQGGAAEVALAERILAELIEVMEKRDLSSEEITRAARTLASHPDLRLRELFDDVVLRTTSKRVIAPKGVAQQRYISAIRHNDIVFGVGPAGTGKTYLAMAMAVGALMDRTVKRIILTRPAVEAGEKLGFLPGDLAEKVNPYLRPLYDALHDMMEDTRVATLIERGTIEVAPLAFMRGRTLNDAFVILDEAQNTTAEQMKMFLTRLGFRSRAVITGDITQVDLPHGQPSGLADAERLLRGIDGISFNYFTDVDVVRHPLVQKIVRAYDERDAVRMAEKRARDEARAAEREARREPRDEG
jgi:phosphate starvation-inducible PhoH-like protein